MNYSFRSFLASACVFASTAALSPALSAQGFGGMFTGFQLNKTTGDDAKTATVITASAADIDLAKNIVTLIGDVVVDDSTSKLSCAKMVIHLEEDAAGNLVGSADKPAEAKKPEAVKPAEVKKPEAVKPAETKKDGEAAAQEEDNAKKNISKIVCTGDVVYLKRANPDDAAAKDQIAMSEQAVYDLKKGVIVMTGKPVMMQGANKMYGDRIEILVNEGNRMRVIDPKMNYAGDSLLTKPVESASPAAGSKRP